MSGNHRLGFGYHQKSLRQNQSYWKALKNSTLPPSPNVLPLYKDKPIHKSSARINRKQMLFKASIIGLAFYLFYYIGWYLKYELKFDTSTGSGPVEWHERQQEVVKAFKDSWKNYEKDAWGYDIYKPISKKGKNMGPKPLGWIIVDSLDTMILMGLEEEVKTAEAWVKNELTYDFDYDVNVFETTIRMIGGLLSAYYLTKKDLYLEKATDLGNRVIGAFDSPSGLPYASVNLKTGKGKKSHVDGGASSTAEVATIQLELKYLSKLTGEKLYWEKAEHVMKVLDNNHVEAGLVPIFVHPDSGKYQGRYIRLGSRGDTYYEYLIKQYLQTDKKEPIYETMYEESLTGIKNHLQGKSTPNGLTFFGELEQGLGGRLSPKMDHLVCFIGGMIALGATEGQELDKARKSARWSPKLESDISLAREITYTCWQMYDQVETGLSPEIVVFNTNSDSTKDFYIKPLDKHNLQRPETVESLFVLYRITKDPIYREWGWKIFQSFEKYTKTESGAYTSLKDATTIPPTQSDNMESFWLAETLKYLYLLFDDDDEKLPLDKVVFNTEAHPFPIFDSRFSTGWSREDELAKEKSTEEKPKLANAPHAAEPAKPAIEELKEEIKQENPVEDTEIGKKLKQGENVNQIIEDLIEH